MNQQKKRVRTRFAPSPTGLLHIGGVRAALFSYLYAKQHKGDFVLRIEDTDRERLVEGGIKQIQKSLEWLGLIPDEGPGQGGASGPYVQSERQQQGLYRQYAEQLISQGKAYYSAISPEGFASLKQAAIEQKQPFVYRQSMEPANPPNSTDGLPIRLKVAPGNLNWSDSVHGEFEVNHDVIDDFIVIKADGYPTYNFANVIDDHLMQISHVVRGPEFLASTPKHALLYDYLGWPRPIYAHCPVILGPDGKKKLSKRDGDVNVLDYRDQGFLPATILNFLALLGWNDGSTQEIFTLEELVSKFSFERVQKSPAQFDIERLKWMSGEYIRNVLTEEEFLVEAKKALSEAKYSVKADENYINSVLLLDRERVKVFSEIPDIVEFFFVPPKLNPDFTKLICAKSDAASVSAWLKRASAALQATEPTEAAVEQVLRSLAEELDVLTGKLFYAIRVALTGRTAAPGLFETITILGRDEVVARLNAAVAFIV